MNIMNVDYSTKIPNNVGLTEDRQVLKALEGWHPGYLDWWNDMGPEGFQESLVYLRTAVSVDPKGWAKFDYVRMPEYRWGVLLAPQDPDRKVNFGQHLGEKAWQEVPGEYRAMLRRLVVIQGDTEPASVEQQRHLGKTAPSLYDMRNLFQVNVEEGRHLWAMVYLLQKYFGRDGREEADELLRRRSGDADSPRMARELGGREAISAALKNLPEGYSVAANDIKAPPYIFQAYKDPVAVTLTLTGYVPDNNVHGPRFRPRHCARAPAAAHRTLLPGRRRRQPGAGWNRARSILGETYS